MPTNVSGGECQSDDDALTVPMKRKRGRPTKDGLPKAPVAKKPVIPRGRGRPRKVKGQFRGRPKTIQNDEEAEDVENGYSSAGDIEEDEDNTKPTTTPSKGSGKGRGRPKKSL